MVSVGAFFGDFVGLGTGVETEALGMGFGMCDGVVGIDGKASSACSLVTNDMVPMAVESDVSRFWVQFGSDPNRESEIVRLSNAVDKETFLWGCSGGIELAQPKRD